MRVEERAICISNRASSARVQPNLCYTESDLRVRRRATLRLLTDLDTLASGRIVKIVRLQLLRDLALVNMLFDKQRNVPGYEVYASYLP